MIEVGDKVRHWCRGFMGRSEDDWMLHGSGIGPLDVVAVHGPCTCAHILNRINNPNDLHPREAHYHVTCALPAPYQQESHYCYFTLRSTRRPWQFRSDGDALHIVAKAPREPQMDLFESPRNVA